MATCIYCLSDHGTVIRMPCMCKSQNGLVHVECQNQCNPSWRCGVCGYILGKDWHTGSTTQENEDDNIWEHLTGLVEEYGPNAELNDDIRRLFGYLLGRIVAIENEKTRQMYKMFEDDEDEEDEKEVEEAEHT